MDELSVPGITDGSVSLVRSDVSAVGVVSSGKVFSLREEIAVKKVIHIIAASISARIMYITPLSLARFAL